MDTKIPKNSTMDSELDCTQTLKLAQIAYKAYGEATDFKNFRGEPMPIWEELPEQIKRAWCYSAMAIYMQPPEPSPPRCRWLVQTGIKPNEPLPELTRLFKMSYDEFNKPNNDEVYYKRLDTTLAYARSLSDPNLTNWVEVKLIWN